MYRRQINEDEKKERKINTKKHKQNITTNNLFRESGSPLPPPPPILFSTKIRNPAGPGRIQCLVCLFVRSFVCLFVQDCDQQLI